MNIKIGVSACLLGQKVRYDGGHKHDPFITDTLGRQFEFVPVCPESEAGLGIPREPMRLTGDPASPCLVTIDTGIDHTYLMLRWAGMRVSGLEAEGLCGFIFKARSPSCGMEVEVFTEDGKPAGFGAGLFAKAFMERFPHLPVLDEDGLHETGASEEFVRMASEVLR